MARRFLLDASALVKRFAVETGTPLVNHLFGHTTHDQLTCLLLNALEVIATLVRKKNRGDLSPADFAQAIANFRQEILDAVVVQKLSTPDHLLNAAIPFIDQYAVNANDAILLAAAKVLSMQIPTSEELVLVASDQRLFKAAQAEGLAVFNPEAQTQADLDALLIS